MPSGNNTSLSELDEAARQDAPVEVVCGCGNEASYSSWSVFTTSNVDAPSSGARLSIKRFVDSAYSQSVCPGCEGTCEQISLLRTPHNEILIEAAQPLHARASDEQGTVRAFGPRTPLSAKRKRYVSVLEEHNSPVDVLCECGYSSEYGSYETFVEAVERNETALAPRTDLGAYNLANVTLTSDGAEQWQRLDAACPSCGGGDAVCTLLDHGPPAARTGYSIRFTMREAAGCPECGSYVSEEGVTSGPEAPELGWDYYECPSCQARMSLNTANLDGPG